MHFFLITQYYPPEIGAAASRWGDYTEILIKQNHKVTILCEAPHYPNSNYFPGYKNHWCNIEKKSDEDLRKGTYKAQNTIKVIPCKAPLKLQYKWCNAAMSL